ncbi:membrane protein [Gordonia phage BENtherdunthat]|uniref:Membrane protein n=1 Tax=Gordonia phage BENtherdunthat TaxID=2047830 RepID=A0A2H4PF57_9CAUD|nr:hypothetical protein HOS44_gp048 [Gordonia phage BENtherdunthat]ATW60818.1 membrane protein [Gordonia phage BENtherdunthat]
MPQTAQTKTVVTPALGASPPVPAHVAEAIRARTPGHWTGNTKHGHWDVWIDRDGRVTTRQTALTTAVLWPVGSGLILGVAALALMAAIIALVAL